MTAFTIVKINPLLFIALASLAIALVSSLLTVITMRAFFWPKHVARRIDEWSNHELSQRDLEINALRRELAHERKIIDGQLVAIKGAAAMLAGHGNG